MSLLATTFAFLTGLTACGLASTVMELTCGRRLAFIKPYVSPDPYVPYTIVAVELAKEKMIVMGQASEGTNVADLKAGMEMELILEPMYSKDDSKETLTWKWKRV